MKVSSLIDAIKDFVSRHYLLAGGLLIVFLYFLFISNLSTHPAGSYVDESCEAYNGYLIAKTGIAENGERYPFFFQCYTQGYTQWMSPMLIYSYSILYTFVPPSVLSARIFSATLVFIATLILGLLAYQISHRKLVAAIVAISAMTTPWLFEVSRLIQETSFLGLSAAILLILVFNAQCRQRWRWTDCLLIGISLGLVTYAYAAGRVLGPLFGVGLLLFVRNWRSFFNVVATGIVYIITLIPFLYTYFTRPLVISGRFNQATNLSASKTISENVMTAVSAYISDWSPNFFLFSGDWIPRHHIAGFGEFLVGTFALGLFGVLIILIYHRRSRWWWFVIYGTLACLVPGSVTYERAHALRGFVFPFFFLTLLTPALVWLLREREAPSSQDAIVSSAQDETDRQSSDGKSSKWAWWGDEQFMRHALLSGLLLVTFIQAVFFHVNYLDKGDERGGDFNEAYPRVLDKALEEGTRPIYLDEGSDPAYIHALWYGTILGVDPSNFVHLLDGQFAPGGKLVISSDGNCTQCQVLNRDGSFTLYRSEREASASDDISGVSKPPAPVMLGSEGGQFYRPQGIAIAPDGTRYVADTGNSRIQKFDAGGTFVGSFGVIGTGAGEIKQPHGIAVDQTGNIFVTDSFRHVLLQFSPDGAYRKEWLGPPVSFYGPRDLAFGPNGMLYIADQGRTRIVRFDTVKEVFTFWGSKGAGPGQFEGLTGIGFGNGFLFVCDAGNDRVQVFDPGGGFVREWSVPQWERDIQPYPDVVYDAASKRIFVSSGKTNEIAVFDPEGTLIESIRSTGEVALNNPSSLFIADGVNGTRLFVLNTGGDDPVTGNPGIAEIEIGKRKTTRTKTSSKPEK